MTLNIELTPEQEARLTAVARREGLEPAEVVRKLVAEHLPAVESPDQSAISVDPTVALFAQWEQEDAQKSQEEIAAEDRLWEAFEQGINAVRQEQGMRTL